jgi:hypothetical protein
VSQVVINHGGAIPLDDLLKEWRNRDHHKDSLFITDGAVDAGLWKTADLKVLFVLKEAYDSVRVEGTWDLPSLIRRKKVWGRTFKPLAQWAYGVREVLMNNAIPRFQEHGPAVEGALMSSAVINLKKSRGIKNSSCKNLRSYVAKDWDLISRQIEILEPDIVICGNTWSLFENKIEKKSKSSDRVTEVHGVPYIDFWHPANRASNKMNFYSLCALVLLSRQSKK